jgi:hypothetical protein
MAVAQTRTTKEMNKLAECEDAVPALFASIGDTFTHVTDYRGDAGDAFAYEGRTSEGWLVFELVSIKLMAVCAMQAVRGPYPSTVYGFQIEKGTWTASNCHQACATCFGSRK